MILGAGGHGRVVAEAAFQMEVWSNIFFLDDNPNKGVESIFPIIGNMAMFEELATIETSFIVAIGNNAIRMAWLSLLQEKNANIAVIIHPTATISNSAKIGLGTVILAGAVVNSNAVVGDGCIVNTHSSMDHDCNLGEGSHLSPGVHLGGSVEIGIQTWIGIGASIINNVVIGEKSIIAAGAVVTRDIPSNVMAAGVPAVVKKHLGAE